MHGEWWRRLNIGAWSWKISVDNHWPYALLGVVGLWLILGWAPYYLCSDSGRFGDTFGAVNSLFSGLAFFGVIVAILYQREELRLQREELRLTRDEVKKQAVSLLWTSTLHALDSLVQYYVSQSADHSVDAPRRQAMGEKCRVAVGSLETLLREIEEKNTVNQQEMVDELLNEGEEMSVVKAAVNAGEAIVAHVYRACYMRPAISIPPGGLNLAIALDHLVLEGVISVNVAGNLSDHYKIHEDALKKSSGSTEAWHHAKEDVENMVKDAFDCIARYLLSS